MMALFSSAFSRDDVLFLLAGMHTTIVIATSTILIALFFSTILGLVHNYDHETLGKLSTVYAETSRNTPLILWILVTRFLAPIPVFYSKILSMSIFTTAIMAEAVRGGLDSINKGQFGAACSQGFDFFQTLRFIIIPRYFKNIVPSLLLRMITTVEDTSFPWTVTIEELTDKGVILTGRFTSSTQVFILSAFMAGMHFIINSTLSSIVCRQNTKGQSLKKSIPVEA